VFAPRGAARKSGGDKNLAEDCRTGGLEKFRDAPAREPATFAFMAALFAGFEIFRGSEERARVRKGRHRSFCKLKPRRERLDSHRHGN